MLDSLILGVVGMTLVFLGLGIVAASTYILEWVFRERGEEREAPPPVGANPVGDIEAPAGGDEAVIAAIALALVKLQSLQRTRAALGKNLEQREADAWTLAARSRQLSTGEGRRR
jgi:Na+-transporting methylmalonyl-CoA/oxaloacetate decarboxylase gamma subunit